MIDAKGGVMIGSQHKKFQQNGAVSLFVVMFTSMLFAAVTVGFTILMLSDQQQSTDNDLAQSALDSAYAGGEDAKRILVQYTACLERGDSALPGSDCQKIYQAIEDNKCNTVSKLSGGTLDGERIVKSQEGDDVLQQAYTCVKISPDTDSYIGRTRSEGDVRIVPLKTDGAPVSTVKVEWLSLEDITGASDVANAVLKSESRDGTGTQDSTIELPTRTQWKDAMQGAILRVGSIQYKPGAINLETIDEQARAVMLHPEKLISGVTKPPIDLAAVDSHRPLTVEGGAGPTTARPNRPEAGVCREDASREYLCEAVLKLPFAEGPDALSRYLTLASFYRDTSFRITLYDGDPNSSPAPPIVPFRNVQPEIDVTGRANDVFRRVVSRVESADASEAPYPRAALGSLGDICKNYMITDNASEYTYTGSGCNLEPRIRNPDAGTSP